MYLITRRGSGLSAHQSLTQAVQAAIKVLDPPCWIWRLEVSRLGTLKRVEVPREEIQRTRIEGIGCIQNRFEKDNLEPVDGQLFFSQAGGDLQILVYGQGKQLQQ
jgi:hypothetical protein